MTEAISPDDPRVKPYDLGKLPLLPVPGSLSSDGIIKVSMINSNSLRAPKAVMVRTETGGDIVCPCYAFLLERKDGSAWMFDLGMRPEPQNGPPRIAELLKLFKVDGEPNPEVFAQLSEGGFDLSKIKGAILSHQHWDHYGDLDALPKIPLILGPGTLASITLGYPENPTSAWFTRWLTDLDILELPSVEEEGVWAGKVAELEATGKNLKWEEMGAFDKAVDFFGDGSMWLIDSPGHCPGHITCLARTTADPPTYILLGGDSCHHQSNYLPVPTCGCPDLRTPLPFYHYGGPDKPPTPMHTDVLSSVKTIGQLTKMSTDENVMVVLAHEKGAVGHLPEWPVSLNDWRKKGYKELKEVELRKELEKGL